MKNLMTKLPWTMDENRYREGPVKRLFLILTLWVNNDLHSPVLHSAGKSTTKALSIDRKNHCREKVWFSIFQAFNLAKWRVWRTICRIRFCHQYRLLTWLCWQRDPELFKITNQNVIEQKQILKTTTLVRYLALETQKYSRSLFFFRKWNLEIWYSLSFLGLPFSRLP